MRQWFSGKFRGHYRGTPSPPSALGPYPDLEHFRVEVYEALVSDIELGPLVHDVVQEPTVEPIAPVAAHHEPHGDTLHQSHIGKVHLVDPFLRGQAVRSTAFDVSMSDIQLSHPARAGKQTLGHIEGRMSGWFRPPPPPPAVEEVPAFEGPAAVGWRTEVGTLAEPVQAERPRTRDAIAATPPQHAEDASRDAAQGNVVAEPGAASEPIDTFPLFAFGMGVAVVLGLFATLFAATLFALTYFFSYGLRRWLLGVVPDVAAVRVLALGLGGGPVLVAALLVARWSVSGCVSLTAGPLIFLLSSQMITSLLPRSLSFVLAATSFAAVLLQAYAIWAPPLCG